MDERVVKDLLGRLRQLEQRSVRIRYGRISDVDPLSVKLGDASVPFTDVRTLTGSLVVNDYVAVLVSGNDLVVLEKMGGGSGGGGNGGSMGPPGPPGPPGPGGSSGAAGPAGATGATGATGPAGTSYTLASSSSVGVTSITLDRSLSPITSGTTYLAIDAFTANCEIRRATTISGAVASGMTALGGSHSAGATVIVFQTYAAAAWWFGATGNGSTADSIALQQGIKETQVAGIGLDGGNRTYIVDLPMLLGPSATLSHVNIKASTSFGPVDTNNADVMNYQGNVRTFTALASDNTFTTPTAHGLPSDGKGVVFKGTGLPAGIVAGRVYYGYNRTSLTFTVSATRGGATVDLTSDGSGTAYCEVQSLNKLGLRNVLIDGNDVAGINGAIFSLQQPSFLDKVRIDNCPGFGLALNGQQAVFTNFQSLDCGTALELDDASFMFFSSFNAELCNKAIHTRTAAQSLWTGSNGAASCLFSGIHIEMNAGAGHTTSSSIAIHLEGTNSQNLVFDVGHATLNTSGETFLRCATGSPSNSSYSIRGVKCSTLGSAGVLAIDDTDRGITLDAFTDYNQFIREFHAPLRPNIDDSGPIRVIGPAGRRLEYGATRDAAASFRSRPGTTQTGAQFEWQTSAGVKATWINKAGVLFTAVNAAPADADLAANQMAIWFDPTNGASALKIKAKQADGTVKMATVALA